MLELVIRFLCAHVLVDFVLLPDSIVTSKVKKSPFMVWLLFHMTLHLLFTAIFLELDARYWPGAVLIAASHGFIDYITARAGRKTRPAVAFLFDQFCHLAIIAAVAGYYSPFDWDLSDLLQIRTVTIVFLLIAVTFGASTLIKVLLGSWSSDESILATEDSLLDAGKYIGILERLFVFGFVVIDQWQAIGLLIAAKSVFRFGDISKAKGRKLTEYVLIGTLLSFGIAILAGLLYKSLLTFWQI